MNKKAQVTLFIIIGILIIAVISLLLLYNSRQTQKTQENSQSQTFTGSVDQQYLNSLINKCVKATVIEAEKRYGIDTKTSSPLITDFVESALPLCVNNFKDFEDEGFSVEKGKLSASVRISRESLVLDLSYPVTMKKAGDVLTFDTGTFTFPRLVTQTLNFNSPTHIVSSDGSMIIDIPAGTRAYVNGKEVKEVGIMQLDRNFNELSNSVLAGMMAYNGWPDGAVFDRPITMTYYFDDRDVPPFIKKENLKVGYYSDNLGIWIGLNTTVDTKANRLSVQTDHFSIYGTVVNCGGGTDPVTQIITPVIVQESCGPCQTGWITKTTGGKTALYSFTAAYDNKAIPYVCGASPSAPAQKSDWVDAKPNPYIPTSPPGTGASISPQWDTCGVTKCQKVQLDYLSFTDIITDTGVKKSITFTPSTDGSQDIKDSLKMLTDKKSVDASNNIVDNQYLTTKELCSANCPSTGKCVDVGSIAGTDGNSVDVYVCKSTSDTNGLAEYKYDDATDLKGRGYYELYFPADGDTCVSSPSDSAAAPAAGAPAPSTVPDLGLNSPAPSSAGAGATQQVKNANSVTIPYKVTPNSKLSDLKLTITPICYDTDTCDVLLPAYTSSTDNAGSPFYSAQVDINGDGKPDKVLALRFYVETTNGGSPPDACLMSSAKIVFSGTNPFHSYNLLCNKDTVGTYDTVQGKCMKCTDTGKPIPSATPGTTDPVYAWAADTMADCLQVPGNNACAASLIGKQYFISGVCYKCTLPPKSLVDASGKQWQFGFLTTDGADCSQCTDPTATAAAATTQQQSQPSGSPSTTTGGQNK